VKHVGSPRITFRNSKATGAEKEPLEFTRDVVYLSAAEYALLTRIVNVGPVAMLPIQEPLTVDQNDMLAAIIKADCGAMDWCPPKGYEEVPPLLSRG
jgi:hypothetical protein